MTRLATILGAAVAVILIGVGLWLVFGRDDAPDEFELTETDAAAEGADTPAVEPADLDGVWAVGAGSEAGYRVVEDLGEVLDFEAVGRTDQVTGEIEISGGEVIGGLFEVDVASITSDDGRRDGQFVGPIMNAAEFPTATLELTGPIPVSGTAASAEATGTLTLRGASNDVTFPVEAQIIGDQIEVVASIDVLFSDYGIDNPSNPLVSVRDEGKVEVRLLLGRA
ncbi:MAG: YceI family protein [Actinomycetota bacterium]